MRSAARCTALVASLKTTREKLRENSQWEKEYDYCLQDNYNLQSWVVHDLLDQRTRTNFQSPFPFVQCIRIIL